MKKWTSWAGALLLLSLSILVWFAPDTYQLEAKSLFSVVATFMAFFAFRAKQEHRAIAFLLVLFTASSILYGPMYLLLTLVVTIFALQKSYFESGAIHIFSLFLLYLMSLGLFSFDYDVSYIFLNLSVFYYLGLRLFKPMKYEKYEFLLLEVVLIVLVLFHSYLQPLYQFAYFPYQALVAALVAAIVGSNRLSLALCLSMITGFSSDLTAVFMLLPLLAVSLSYSIFAILFVLCFLPDLSLAKEAVLNAAFIVVAGLNFRNLALSPRLLIKENLCILPGIAFLSYLLWQSGEVLKLRWDNALIYANSAILILISIIAALLYKKHDLVLSKKLPLLAGLDRILSGPKAPYKVKDIAEPVLKFVDHRAKFSANLYLYYTLIFIFLSGGAVWLTYIK